MTDAKALARRVMENLFDENSPATNRAIVLDSLFELIPVDEATATATVLEAASIIAAVALDLLTVAPGNRGAMQDLIDLHTT